ncbi:hypothetical protein QBC37DRAFT_376980 [Rhypophila decipiens]|uniref:Uncharacterized protein n=1 Tax=Rhypophila decipiens TaxID=261697 RepID=A0AAN7B4Z8_9PEZI|nr:hypothetical protein QBC37DRAFT_376980 [Rhypophila decipiens]
MSTSDNGGGKELYDDWPEFPPVNLSKAGPIDRELDIDATPLDKILKPYERFHLIGLGLTIGLTGLILNELSALM